MSSDRAQIEQAVGQAAYTLCIDPKYGYIDGSNLARIRSASILNAGLAIRYAAEFHHGSMQVLVWHRGSCSRPSDLTTEGLDAALGLLRAERATRA